MPQCMEPSQDHRPTVAGPMRAGSFHHREAPGVGLSGSMAVPAPQPSAQLCQRCPRTEETQEPRGTLAPSVPLPSKLQHHTTACHLHSLRGALPVPCQTPCPHSHIHPHSIALGPACAAQGKAASTCSPRGTPHAPQPKGCGWARYCPGGRQDTWEGADREGWIPETSGGSPLQHSQALGIRDNCPALGCGFAQEKTKR